MYHSFKRNVYTPAKPKRRQTIKQGYEVHTALIIDGDILVKSSTHFQTIYTELLHHLQIDSQEYLDKCRPMIGDGKKYPYFWSQKLHLCPVSRAYVSDYFFTFNTTNNRRNIFCDYFICLYILIVWLYSLFHCTK